MASLTTLRSRFAGLAHSSHKEMGLRRIRDAIALGDRNPERIAELTAQAVHHLSYAEEISRRER